MGHVAFKLSHSSMHSAWKQCGHSGMVFRVSLGWYSDRHIGQVLSLGLGRRRLSPRTIFGQDSIVAPSRPIVILGCGAIVVLNSKIGWRLLALQDLILPHRKHSSPAKHMLPGTPTPMVMAQRALLAISEHTTLIFIKASHYIYFKYQQVMRNFLLKKKQTLSLIKTLMLLSSFFLIIR